MSRVVTYRPKPIAFERGEGSYLYDHRGTKYLDAITGIGACPLGHSHPNLVRAITEQTRKFLHCSNMFTITAQQQLAETLCKLTGMQQIFFCNSGAEGIETAIKCMRLYARAKNITDPKIITVDGAFHGRTFGALSASKAKTREMFNPVLPGFIQVPFNNVSDITKLQNKHEIVGVLLEPIQGENGVVIPDDNYLSDLRKLCDEHAWLLALDEVQTGAGRTGKLFEYMHHDIYPDILVSAKGLAGGVPIGACLMNTNASDLLQFGTHGSTFGGNPLACTSASAVIDTIMQDNLMENAYQQGQYLLEAFGNIKLNSITDIRGRGLMLAIEMNKECKEISSIAIEHKLLINVTNDKVIRILPPLNINEQECNELSQKLALTLQDWHSRN